MQEPTKKFKDVMEGEFLYFISPRNGQIKTTKVQKISTESKKFPGYIGINLLKNYSHVHAKLNDEMMENAQELLGNNTNQSVFLPKDSFMVILQQKYPTLICTDFNYLVSWQKKTA